MLKSVFCLHGRCLFTFFFFCMLRSSGNSNLCPIQLVSSYNLWFLRLCCQMSLCTLHLNVATPVRHVLWLPVREVHHGSTWLLFVVIKKKITTCENKTALRKNITQMLVCFYCWESNTSTVYFFDLFNRSFVNRYYVCHLPHWWKLPEHRMCCNEEVSTDDFFTFVSNYICSIFQICFKYK